MSLPVQSPRQECASSAAPGEQQEASAGLDLPLELRIETVGRWREALRASLAQQPELEIDLRSVGACDAAGLQLLAAARKSAEAAGKPFRLVGPVSSVVSETAAALGIRLEGVSRGA